MKIKIKTKALHPSPYSGLESCEVCWADEEETDIKIYQGIPYCDTCLSRAREDEK